MPLERHDAPRFTLEQRDEILNLAARLQVQHDATVGADELVREAEAAGIDPRFVYEATVRLGRKSRPTTSLREPLFAFVLFTFQAGFLMADSFGWFRHSNAIHEWPELLLAAAISLLLALWSARTRSIRRYVPLAPVPVWLVVMLLTASYTRLVEGSVNADVVPSALLYGLFQVSAALVAVLVRNAAEWRPEGGGSFRLHRHS